MYFEIYGAKNQVVETDNLRDVEKMYCVGSKVVYNGLTLAEYSAATRAAEVLAELKDPSTVANLTVTACRRSEIKVKNLEKLLEKLEPYYFLIGAMAGTLTGVLLVQWLSAK